MSKLFITAKEINLFNTINKELIQKIVEQKIVYYSVSDEHTKANRLYDESIKKTVYSPVEIHARVLYKDPEQNTTNFSIDTKYNIECYFHLDELSERKIIAREGDFIKWGEVLYEINKLTYPQLTFGSIEEKVMAKCECTVSRKSNFEVFEQ